MAASNSPFEEVHASIEYVQVNLKVKMQELDTVLWQMI